jgi:translation initiation factor IF-3
MCDETLKAYVDVGAAGICDQPAPFFARRWVTPSLTERSNQSMFHPGPAVITSLVRDSRVVPGSVHRQKGDLAIRRPMKAAPVPQKDGPRINQEIRVREVQLIDAEGQNRGVVDIYEAQQTAEQAGLDLVEIVPSAIPPVCKILDYGKFRFLEQKKSAEARKKQKIVEVKEIKLRPGIDDHDYGVKMKAVRRFFEEGDKVKVTLRFRGREMAHQDLGLRLLERVKSEIANIAKVEIEPSIEGRQMVMVLAPK